MSMIRYHVPLTSIHDLVEFCDREQVEIVNSLETTDPNVYEVLIAGVNGQFLDALEAHIRRQKMYRRIAWTVALFLVGLAAFHFFTTPSKAEETVNAASCRALTPNIATTGNGAGLFVKGPGKGTIVCPLSRGFQYLYLFYVDSDGIGLADNVQFNVNYTWGFSIGAPHAYYPVCAYRTDSIYRSPALSYATRYCDTFYDLGNGQTAFVYIILNQSSQHARPIDNMGFVGIQTY